jgi:aldose 1-epimerase
MLPTGRCLPVNADNDLRSGLRFADAQLDDVLTQLSFQDGLCTSQIFDVATRARISISSDREFSHCVAFKPPHGEAVCLEPYTCMPNAFELEASGVDTGLQILAPGGSWSARIAFSCEALTQVHGT